MRRVLGSRQSDRDGAEQYEERNVSLRLITVCIVCLRELLTLTKLFKVEHCSTNCSQILLRDIHTDVYI